MGGGSFSVAQDGILVPSSFDAEASFDLAYTGVFEMRWNYSSFTGNGATSAGTEVGIIPSTEHVLTLPIPMINDSVAVNDNPAGDILRIYTGPSFTNVANATHPLTTDVLMYRRDENDVITFYINDVLQHTFAGTFPGAIAAAVRSNVTGTDVANLESREYIEP